MTLRLMLFAAVLALVASGCASGKKAPYREPKRSRDYTSVNRESVSFLMSTFRQDRDLRREHRKYIWKPSEIREQNKQVRKESLAFLWDALKAGEADAWKFAWTDQLPELVQGPENFAASVRFGFLDSGD